jgi:ABC-type Fe3+-hydroxamate transport system substrate-binding protein
MRDKRAKFVHLANQRVNRAIDQIRLVGNLANRNAYEYTDEDSRKIIKALQKSLEKAKARFADDAESSDQQFSL